MTAKDWFLLIVSLIIWYFLDVDFLRQLLNEHQDQANSCISVKAPNLRHENYPTELRSKLWKARIILKRTFSKHYSLCFSLKKKDFVLVQTGTKTISGASKNI